MKGGIEALDKISSNVSISVLCKYLFLCYKLIQPGRYSAVSKDLAQFVSPESKKVGELFEHLLQRKYPEKPNEKSFNLSLRDLLTWPHWPSFIRICSKCANIRASVDTLCI